MAEAVGIVVIAVTILAAVIAVVALAMAPKAYEQIGRGGMSLRDEPAPPEPPAAGAVRDDEIRQMLRARNERRARRGEAQLDVDAELRRLTAASADPGLRDEVRQLVLARNARLRRTGRPEVDVEAEVDRRLRELTG